VSFGTKFAALDEWRNILQILLSSSISSRREVQVDSDFINFIQASNSQLYANAVFVFVSFGYLIFLRHGQQSSDFPNSESENYVLQILISYAIFVFYASHVTNIPILSPVSLMNIRRVTQENQYFLALE